MKNKRKILFVISALTMGGAENSLIKLLNEINNYYEIDVLLLEKKGYWIDKLPDNVELIYLFDPKSEKNDSKIGKAINKIRLMNHRIGMYISKYTNYYYVPIGF